MTNAAVQLETAEGTALPDLPYDYLFLAPGVAGPSPWAAGAEGHPVSRAERIAWFKTQAETLAMAKRVLIVGGGVVGCELAGEILQDYTGAAAKEVTIVHSGPALLLGGGVPKEAIPAKLVDNMLVKLKAMGLKDVHTGDRVNMVEGRFEAVTAKGVPVPHDMVFNCVGGFKPATAFLAGSAVALDERGCIIVDATLAVPGSEGRIFAAGDAAALKDLKGGYFASLQAEAVAANLVAAIRGHKVKAIKPNDQAIFISLGRKDGVGNLGGSVFNSGCFISMVKSKDLFVSKVRKEHGV